MRRLLLAAVLSCAIPAASPGAADPPAPDGAPCGDGLTTAAIVACIDGRTRIWDRRLNAAYAALQRRIEAGQRDPLRTAQRLWVQYRDANCRFYGSQDGTIRLIHAAECSRAMTQDRALELERAMVFE